MNAIQELKNEHQAVLTTLKILDRITTRFEDTGVISDPGHLDALLEFFRVFVDRCHHAKEEEMLFPALEAHGVPREGGPIGVMLAEHQHGRDHIKEMAAALSAYQAGDRQKARRLIPAARDYIALLEAHIEKEDNVLFPMAEERLGAPKQDELFKAFEKLETEKIGPGKHEEFHVLLDKLAEVYLTG